MYRFDKVLIDPTPEGLSAFLDLAAVAANRGYRARLLWGAMIDFASFVADSWTAPEGERQWIGPGTHRTSGPGGDTRSAVAVAWWSDPLGRKHCRVIGDRIDCGSAEEQSLFWPDNRGFSPASQRPVLWRVYPDDLYLREVKGEWTLWAACRCGAAGPPEKLGWMGPWCAACHDRAEAGTPLTRPGTCRSVVFSGHPFWVTTLAFCLEGRSLAVGIQHHAQVWVWDTLTGQVQKRTFSESSNRKNPLAVAPNGRTAAFSWGHEFLLWSLDDGTDRFRQSFPDGLVGGALAFSPDSSLLAAACPSNPIGQLFLYDPTTGQVRRTLSIDLSRFHFSEHNLAFSPDGRVLALGCGRPAVRRWDVASGEELAPLPGNRSRLSAIAFSPDGQVLAACLDEGPEDNVWLWDPISGSVTACFPGPVAGLAFSPDSRLLATVGRDGCLRLRRTTDGHLLGSFRWHQSDINAVAFSPDGQWLATGGGEDRVKLWPVDALLPE
jgi:WD40 repeat protein